MQLITAVDHSVFTCLHVYSLPTTAYQELNWVIEETSTAISDLLLKILAPWLFLASVFTEILTTKELID